MAKRKADPYAAGVTRVKIKNRAYSQMKGGASCSTLPEGRRRTMLREGSGIVDWCLPDSSGHREELEPVPKGSTSGRLIWRSE